MFILQRDCQGFQGAEQPNREDEDCRYPNAELKPVRRTVFQFNPKAQCNDNKPYNQYDKDSRPIAAINGFQVLPTNRTFGINIQESGKQCPLSAGRAFAGNTGAKRRYFFPLSRRHYSVYCRLRRAPPIDRNKQE